MNAIIAYRSQEISFIDVIAAARINPRVIGRRTERSFSILLLSLNLSNNFDIIVSPTSAKTITPTVDAKEPKNPAVLNPTKVAVFIAIGPGVDWDKAIRSKNSWLDMNL